MKEQKNAERKRDEGRKNMGRATGGETEAEGRKLKERKR